MPKVDLSERKLGLNAFLQQRMSILVDFIGQLGFPEPYRVLNETHLFIRGVSDWIAHQQISPTDRAWLASRMGYLIGEYLIAQFKGEWFVCDNEESEYVGRYVVGRFLLLPHNNASVDPMEAAMSVVSGQKQLITVLEDVKRALAAN